MKANKYFLIEHHLTSNTNKWFIVEARNSDDAFHANPNFGTVQIHGIYDYWCDAHLSAQLKDVPVEVILKQRARYFSNLTPCEDLVSRVDFGELERKILANMLGSPIPRSFTFRTVYSTPTVQVEKNFEVTGEAKWMDAMTRVTTFLGKSFVSCETAKSPGNVEALPTGKWFLFRALGKEDGANTRIIKVFASTADVALKEIMDICTGEYHTITHHNATELYSILTEGELSNFDRSAITPTELKRLEQKLCRTMGYFCLRREECNRSTYEPDITYWIVLARSKQCADMLIAPHGAVKTTSNICNPLFGKNFHFTTREAAIDAMLRAGVTTINFY